MDNREGLDNHDNSLFFEDADVEFSQESLESLADDYASRGALDYEFSNTSNTSFFSSSVQLKSLKKCNITVDN
jgi:hypothetical protein